MKILTKPLSGSKKQFYDLLLAGRTEYSFVSYKQVSVSIIFVAILVTILLIQAVSTVAQVNPPQTGASKTNVQSPALTAEGYRDSIVSIADAVFFLNNKILTGISSDRKCFTVDTAQSKLAAKAARSFHKKWSGLMVPDSLKASYKEILSWIGSAQQQFEVAAPCLEGGSMPLFMFLGIFGKYEDVRKQAGLQLEKMGVVLPPIAKKP